MTGQPENACPVGRRIFHRTTRPDADGMRGVISSPSDICGTGQVVRLITGHVRSRTGRTTGGYLYPPCPASGVRSAWWMGRKDRRSAVSAITTRIEDVRIRRTVGAGRGRR